MVTDLLYRNDLWNWNRQLRVPLSEGVVSFGIQTPGGLPGIIPFEPFGSPGKLESDEEENPAAFMCLGATREAGTV